MHGKDTSSRRSIAALRKRENTPGRHEAKTIKSKHVDFTSDLKLCGRQNELQTLSTIYQTTYTSKKTNSVGTKFVLVSGQSGTGKTSLVKHAFDDKEGMCISGKFDQLSSSRPFAALVDAFEQLCQLIAESADRDGIFSDLCKALDSTSLEDFVTIIPKSKCLLGSPSPSSKESPMMCEDKATYSLDRVKTLLLSFVECVSKRLTLPLVIFIDDLQWSDAGSLQLLETFLTSKRIERTLIVASCRDEELPAPVQQFLDKQHSWIIPCSKIELKNLTQLDIEEIIIHLTKRRDSTDVSQLADIILKNRRQLTWDLVQIKTEMSASMNIVDFMDAKMELIPPSKAKALMVSSFLGSSFSVATLSTIMCSDESWTMEQLHDALDYAEKEGLMESVGSEECPRFKFIHNRLQQSAYRMVHESDKAALHWRVGWALYSSKAVSETAHFLAMEHLNTAVELGAPNCLGTVKLAELNFETAKKAKVRYALIPARSYLRAATLLLELESPWDEHYDLILDVTKLTVEVQIALGSFEDACRLCDRALIHTRSCDDAFHFHFLKLNSLSGQGNFVESINVGLQSLSELGTKIPKQVTQLRLIVKIISVRRKLKRMTNEQILGLPDMVDKRSLLILDGIVKLMVPIFHLGDDDLLTFMCLKQIESQLKWGLASAFSFSFFGYICIALNDVHEACRFGELSLLLQDRFDFDTSTKNLLINFGHLHAWKKPLHECIDPLWSAYNHGFRSGLDLHCAGLCGVDYANAAFHCGLYLPDLYDTLSQIVSVLNIYRQSVVEDLANVERQRIANFLGRNDGDVMVLNGVAMNETTLLASSNVDRKLRLGIVIEKVMISVYFTRTWPQAMQDVFTTSLAEWKMTGFYFPWISFIALASMRLAKSHFQRRKNLHRARTVMKDYENSCKNGNVNAHVLWLLLNAEYRVVTAQGTRCEIKAAFDKAISVAKRSGFINIAGLGKTLAAEFLQNSGETFWKDYAKDAVELYREWGASALVKHLEFKFLLQTSLTCLTSDTYDDKESGSRSFQNSSHFVEAHQGKNLTSTLVVTM